MVLHRILIRLRTIVAIAFAIVLFFQIILFPYDDFSFSNKDSIQPVFALDQNKINKLKEDLQIIGAIQNAGAITAGEIVMESTKCPVELFIYDCGLYQVTVTIRKTNRSTGY